MRFDTRSLLVVMRLGNSHVEMCFSQCFKRVLPCRRIQHVSSERRIECIAIEHIGVGKKCALRRIDRIHFVQRRFRVESSKRALFCNARKYRESLVAFDEGNALGSRDGKGDFGSEQRFLSWLRERHAHTFAFRQRALDDGKRLFALHGLCKLECRCSGCRTFLPDKLQQLVEMSAEADGFVRFGDRLGIE